MDTYEVILVIEELVTCGSGVSFRHMSNQTVESPHRNIDRAELVLGPPGMGH